MYSVLCHKDASSEQGESNGTSLEGKPMHTQRTDNSLKNKGRVMWEIGIVFLECLQTKTMQEIDGTHSFEDEDIDCQSLTNISRGEGAVVYEYDCLSTTEITGAETSP